MSYLWTDAVKVLRWRDLIGRGKCRRGTSNDRGYPERREGARLAHRGAPERVKGGSSKGGHYLGGFIEEPAHFCSVGGTLGLGFGLLVDDLELPIRGA
jgi:hypothetical protein